MEDHMKSTELNTQMNPEISRNITLLRYPAIVMVVMIHNVFEYAPLPVFCQYFERFFSYSFPQVGVPIFFAAAGYLLFHKAEFGNASYAELIKRRFQSLVIPYIFWNAAVLAFYLIGPRLPVLGKFFLSGRLDNYQWYDYILRAFGITEFYPIAFQFWFIRNLVIFVLLYPVFLWIMRRIQWQILVLGAIAMLFLPKYPFEGLSYFLMGGILAVNKLRLEGTRKYLPYLTLCFAAGVVLYTVYLWPMRLSLLCGVLLCYHLASWCAEHEKIKQVLTQLAPSSIFVFAAHGLFSGTLRRVLQKIFMPQSSLSLIFFYFLSLVITVAAMTGLYFILKKIAPKLLKFACGR